MNALVRPSPLRDGVVWDMPHADYLAAPGLSRSELARILERSPYHQHELERENPNRPPPPEPTPQMFAGTLLHCALLEPHAFAERYPVGPEVYSRAVKAWKEFEAAHPGRECITPQQQRVALAQAEALRRTPMGDSPDDGTLGDLLAGARVEASAFWTDEATQLRCKCRPDAVVEVGDDPATWGSVLVDVKTTSNAKDDTFNKSIVNFQYDMQHAHYATGWAIATQVDVVSFLFACVEHEFPHATALYVLPEDWVEYGRARCRAALDLYAECQRTGRWPAYGVGVQTLEPPKWHPVARDRRDTY